MKANNVDGVAHLGNSKLSEEQIPSKESQQKDEKADEEDVNDDDLNELEELDDEYMDEDLLSLDSYYSGKLIQFNYCEIFCKNFMAIVPIITMFA